MSSDAVVRPILAAVDFRTQNNKITPSTNCGLVGKKGFKFSEFGDGSEEGVLL
jgi:hypothetical protein